MTTSTSIDVPRPSWAFLTARWTHLLLANFAVPQDLLRSRMPTGLELDLRDGQAFVSLVFFDFLDTRVLGVPWPGFRNFSEINLRFYVRRGDERGVVFVREFVPRRFIAWIGRNVEARKEVDHFLRALKLEPVDFDELAAGMGVEFVGNIVLEGLKRAQGIVVLFTPDEYSSLLPSLRSPPNDTGPASLRWQSRPNVLFEAGIAFGIARDRSVLVTLGSEVSLFSDADGLHIVRLDNTVESRRKFRQKLIGMQCELDLVTGHWIDPKKSGDFVSPLNALIENVSTEVLDNWTVELLAPRPVVVGVSNQNQGAFREKHSDEKTSLFNNSLAHAKEHPIRPGGKYAFKISYQVTEDSVRLLNEKVVARAYVREKIEDQKERPLSELTSFFAAPAVALREASKLRSGQVLGSRG